MGTPLLDRAKPRVVVLGQRGESPDKGVTSLRAELPDHRPHDEEVGTILDVQEKSQEGVSGIVFKRCECFGNRNEVRLGEFRDSQVVAGKFQNSCSGTP
jgi:hypothetical protein